MKNEYSNKTGYKTYYALRDLISIAEEIANDPKCDLVTSDRRLKLYQAIYNADCSINYASTKQEKMLANLAVNQAVV